MRALALMLIVLAGPVLADVTVTPYLEAGAWYRDCAMTDIEICNYDFMGGDWPGTVEIGLQFKPDRPSPWLLWADHVKLARSHQSYIDRGHFLWLDAGGEEANLDMTGLKFTWEFNRLAFRF
jgi:hypothetical protein